MEEKQWSFYDDAVVLRFIDFLSESGKTLESPEAEEMFDTFIESQGDDSYTYWASYWDAPVGAHGGTDASST